MSGSFELSDTSAWSSFWQTSKRAPLKLPVVWGCVAFAIGRLQSMPYQIRNLAGMPQAVPRWVRQPNEYLSWIDLVSTAVVSLWMAGNWYLLPIRGASGRPVSLVIPHPSQVQPILHPNGTAEYFVDGVPWDLGEIIHVRNVTLPGQLIGLSAIEAARQRVDAGLYAQDFVVRHFKQGAAIQYAVSTDAELGPDTRRELAVEIEAAHHGARNAWRPFVMDRGLKAMPLNVSAEDAQFLQLSQHTDATITGQIFHTDPTLLGIMQPGSQLTYQNSQQRQLNHWLDALQPLATRIQQGIGELLPLTHGLHINPEALLSGTPSDRALAAERMANINMKEPGIYSPDEIRAVTGHGPQGV